MSRCPGCGGIIGRDCFNPTECVNIGHAIEEDHLQRRERDFEGELVRLNALYAAQSSSLQALESIAERIARSLHAVLYEEQLIQEDVIQASERLTAYQTWKENKK